MGGTIIHTQAKEFIAKSGTKRTRTTGQYAPKIEGLRQETDYGQFLHWTTEAGMDQGNQELLGKQSKTVEALVKVLKETLDSKKARHGLSLDTANFVAREAGFRGGREVTEAVDRAGACLVARMPDRYKFKGDLVLAKKL